MVWVFLFVCFKSNYFVCSRPQLLPSGHTWVAVRHLRKLSEVNLRLICSIDEQMLRLPCLRKLHALFFFSVMFERWYELRHCSGPQFLECLWFRRHNRIWWLNMGRPWSVQFPSHPAVICLSYLPMKRCISKLKICGENMVWGEKKMKRELFCFHEVWFKQFPFTVEKTQANTPILQNAMGAEEGHGKGSETELLVANIILGFGSSFCCKWLW